MAVQYTYSKIDENGRYGHDVGEREYTKSGNIDEAVKEIEKFIDNRGEHGSFRVFIKIVTTVAGIPLVEQKATDMIITKE